MTLFDALIYGQMVLNVIILIGLIVWREDFSDATHKR